MDATVTYKEIDIPMRDIRTKGNLRLAPQRKGIILFSHGSGSSRLSPRNNFVADILYNNGFSSLLFDLLSPQEEISYINRFDIQLLTSRLVYATEWIYSAKDTKDLPIGYFGASTGAASALSASIQLGSKIKAVVSRGGRPDLAMAVLPYVKAPTLLLVGSRDLDVMRLNEEAKSKISGVCRLKIIEGATHLFPERGKLDLVAKLASDWFDRYL